MFEYSFLFFSVKTRFEVEEYSFGQTTLEQVFIEFAKQQEEADRSVRGNPLLGKTNQRIFLCFYYREEGDDEEEGEGGGGGGGDAEDPPPDGESMARLRGKKRSRRGSLEMPVTSVDETRRTPPPDA